MTDKQAIEAEKYLDEQVNHIVWLMKYKTRKTLS